VKIPKTQPFAVFEDCTQPSQACSIIIAGTVIAFWLIIYFKPLLCFSFYAIDYVNPLLWNYGTWRDRFKY
jgi:hypothetical protein